MNRQERHAAHRQRQRQIVLDTVAAGVADIHKIALALGLSKVAARKHLTPLLGGSAGGGQVRISHWIDPEATIAARENYPRPFYALGSDPDETKPGAQKCSIK